MKLVTTVSDQNGKPINDLGSGNKKAYEPLPAKYSGVASLRNVEKAINPIKSDKVLAKNPNAKNFLAIKGQAILANDVSTSVFFYLTVGIMDDAGNLLPDERGQYIWAGRGGAQNLLASTRQMRKVEGEGAYEVDFNPTAMEGQVVKVSAQAETEEYVDDKGKKQTRLKNKVVGWYPYFPNEGDEFFEVVLDEQNSKWYISEDAYNLTQLLSEPTQDPDW